MFKGRRTRSALAAHPKRPRFDVMLDGSRRSGGGGAHGESSFFRGEMVISGGYRAVASARRDSPVTRKIVQSSRGRAPRLS